MDLRVRAFQLPKAGNSPEEYEDAFEFDTMRMVIAVADGASDSFESRIWAQALVQTFVRRPPAANLNGILEWLSDPIKLWKQAIEWEKLPWYAEEKARRGSFSTLLGLTLKANSDTHEEGVEETYHWRAIAIGDACFFQIRKNKLHVSFPLDRAADFGTTPALVSTRLDYTQQSLEELRVLEGDCTSEDTLIVSTDSFAAWVLARAEKGEEPWVRFPQLSSSEFGELVNLARREEQMRNDDVTLLVIGFSEPPDATSSMTEPTCGEAC
jgi:hypothetical protein